MSISTVWNSRTSASALVIEIDLDYDTVNQTVGITCTNGTAGVPADGTGTLTLAAPTPANVIGAVTTGQFNDGARHILAGPGATGLDTQGRALPTSPISAATVARIEPVKGQTNTAFVDLRTIVWA